MPKRIAAFSPPRLRESAHIKEAIQPRPNAAQRGYNSREWYALRKQVLLRDAYKCQTCGRICVNKREAQVDHITPKARGGLDELENLQTLCLRCHSRKTARENNRSSTK